MVWVLHMVWLADVGCLGGGGRWYRLVGSGYWVGGEVGGCLMDGIRW